MDKISGIFSQPYPLDAWLLSPWMKLVRSVGEGTFIALFLIIFQPFGASNWDDPNRNYYLLGYGVITAISSLVMRFGIAPSFPKYFSETNWTVGREIISILLLVLFIAAGNFAYEVLIFSNRISLFKFAENVATVLLIGAFPIAFGVVMNYVVQLKKYQKPIAVKHHEEMQAPKSITLIAENEKDTFEVLQSDLFFIESADNYAVINYVEAGQIKKELLRSSLTRLVTQLDSYDIVRCHRSFIVNLNKVAEVTGNAQGYKFHLQAPELTVPVARKYSELVKRIS